ncbi:uncharacterized protein LOC126878855 isoform X2 [Diabrotica virgifera virgifera]|uniref:DUF4806 domain-containing protein n=1 Tax=Diabrotica virgifera virgifera TaxID=50390 RepID=A0ABM5JIE9_DIAVI|nr:uncharacterized protein LOC126878855 isoform X2 [Diabrotica virgifera virgifera]
MEPHFKIVETIEAGRSVLTVVPHKWIKNKILFWPPKNVKNLIKDVNSTPDITWNKIICRIKRNYYKNRIAAETELLEMSGGSATSSTDSEVLGEMKEKNKVRNTKKVTSQQNFETLFASSSSKFCSFQPIIPEETPEPVVESENIILETNFSDEAIISPEAIANAQFLNVIEQPLIGEESKNDIINKLNDIEQKFNQFKNDITESVKDMLVKAVAAIKSDFDAKLLSAMQNFKNNHQDDDNIQFEFHAVSTSQELSQLEDNLKDPNYEKKVRNYFKKIIGNTPDTSNGLDTCYSIVDYFFEKKFMVQCSWTGGSRSNTEKCCIKNCKNILEVFFTIVQSSNKDFSKALLKKFIIGITRNAKKRSLTGGIRQSSIHRRKKSMVKKQRLSGNRKGVAQRQGKGTYIKKMYNIKIIISGENEIFYENEQSFNEEKEYDEDNDEYGMEEYEADGEDAIIEHDEVEEEDNNDTDTD